MLFRFRFLDYEFSTYGTKVLEFTLSDYATRTDPMEVVFPKVTKCSMHIYGASGTISRLDSLCLLPVNVLNEKMFIFLWFWYILISMITFLGLLYRLLTFCSCFRKILLRTRSRAVPQLNFEIVTRHCGVGDWFILYQLGKN